MSQTSFLDTQLSDEQIIKNIVGSDYPTKMRFIVDILNSLNFDMHVLENGKYNADYKKITEEQYSTLYKMLVELESSTKRIYGLKNGKTITPNKILNDSPTRRNQPLSNTFDTVEHSIIFREIPTSSNIDEINTFFLDNVPSYRERGTCDVVLDWTTLGIPLYLTYQDACLTRCTIRLNDSKSIDVTNRAIKIPTIPLKITCKDLIEIKGVVTLPDYATKLDFCVDVQKTIEEKNSNNSSRVLNQTIEILEVALLGDYKKYNSDAQIELLTKLVFIPEDAMFHDPAKTSETGLALKTFLLNNFFKLIPPITCRDVVITKIPSSHNIYPSSPFQYNYYTIRALTTDEDRSCINELLTPTTCNGDIAMTFRPVLETQLD
ncbi:MAG: hypothetical protein LBE09_00985 [Christensenellaceae bacterium]|nr:hypothetical protein [Christensenellaceae bacterium]